MAITFVPSALYSRRKSAEFSNPNNEEHMTDFRTLLKRRVDTDEELQLYRSIGLPDMIGSHNDRIEIGRYAISIQGSARHYSEPRITIDDPTAYTHYEVAVFLDDEWVLFREGPLSQGPWTKYLDPDFGPHMQTRILTWVPENIIQALYNKLVELDANSRQLPATLD